MKYATTLMAALAVFCFIGTANADLNNMDIGGDVKVLGTYTDNTIAFDDDYDDKDSFLRVEAHLWFQADLSDNVTAKISLEADKDFEADVENGDDNTVGGFNSKDSDLAILLEEAWIQMAYIYDSAFNVKVGRQFIELGDGFVVGDALPIDPLYLNALGEYEVDPFDALLVSYDGDDWMLHFLYAAILETRLDDVFTDAGDVDLWSIYFSYSGWESYEFDLYFIYVNGNVPIPTGPLYSVAPGLTFAGPSDLFNVGARFAGEPVDGLTFKIEVVYQWGELGDPTGSDDIDVSAWAVEAGIKYVFQADYNPFITFNYVFMTGDDGNDDDWDAYTMLFENRVYGEIFDPYTYFGNLHIFNLGGGFDVSDDIALSAHYYYFHAVEDGGQFADDDAAGHELDVYMDYQFSEETSAVLAAGFFVPEDAVEDVYGLSSPEDDTAWFVRAGVKVEF